MLKTPLKKLKICSFWPAKPKFSAVLFIAGGVWYTVEVLNKPPMEERMRFIPNVDYQAFDAFVKAHPTKSHFMQSAAWGEFNRVQRGCTVHRVALADEQTGELQAAALLLERKPTAFPPYLYCPRGFVLDFENRQLLAEMTAALRGFAKSRGAMFLALDPDIKRRDIAPDGSAAEGGQDNSALADEMRALGYRHRGWNLGFEGREPRFTFRIPLQREEKEIEKAFTGNILKNVKKSRHYAVSVREGGSEDIKTLHEIIGATAQRDSFYAYPLEYYQNFYDSLAKDGMAHLYLGIVDPAETVRMLKAELAELLAKREKLKKPGPLAESAESEARLLREIAQFEAYAAEYSEPVTVSAHLVVRYGEKSWAVHAGSRGIMNETFVNNRTYYEKLMAQKRAGCVFLDMFGTVGNPEEDGPFKTVHAFKRQWGGEYLEFIGQFDLVTRPMWYLLYERLRPAYHRLRIGMKAAARKLSGGRK